MRNFLIFESTEPIEEYTGSVIAHDPSGRVIQREDGVTQRRQRKLDPYKCIGAVRAKDETAAARAVVGVTRRLTKLAVVEASFIDFTQDADEPEADRAELNP